ncbi:glutathione S-transferase [Lophiostoma macrostomum CBS 122681]|uniref:Glutathione S-transferase n=1 Tax=Lophiostoma macrostomum CBS 122681 TaxID=1314788 RepID=A0A6A6TLW9_9PLEO|nr:glutathione S-transferase [Lophiostoma macrostomum CBS 122681]
MSQPITVWSAPGGPNPFKVVIVCEELGLPYDFKVLPYAKLKSKPYTDINPNGRAPAIQDPNTGLTIWESGAILEYLVETYDKDNKIHYDSLEEKNQQRQYVFFQVSGQGPYFGQAAWFNVFHPNKIAEVQERYNKEVNRVVGVLDEILAQSKSGWLVGDKCTYADLIFIPYNEAITGMIFAQYPGVFNIDEYPHYKKWTAALKERPAVKKGLELMAQVTADAYAGKYQ